MYHLVTGRPPFEADTPSAVMHKHLKQPLKPPDHINTALSAGISEIIEVAMAKKREDRYASTRDMLEDLRAVQTGQSPTHARRSVNLDAMKQLEETGKTVDLTPAGHASMWAQPMVVTLLSITGVSILVNLILLVVLLVRS
jgi:serine/threonine-protein kinase